MKTTTMTVAFVALALTACGASTSEREEQTVDRGALDSERAELARVYRASDGSETYATDLQLKAGGAFAASLNRELLGGQPCPASPCTVPVKGRWSAHWDELTVQVESVEGQPAAELTMKFRFRVEGGLFRTLILEGVSHPRGEQRFDERKDAVSGCVTVQCGDGTRCVEDAVGQGSCVPDTSAFCENKQCGDRCSTCTGGLACTQELKHCDAQGQCVSTTGAPVCQ